jgi:hypothetical protein
MVSLEYIILLQMHAITRSFTSQQFHFTTEFDLAVMIVCAVFQIFCTFFVKNVGFHWRVTHPRWNTVSKVIIAEPLKHRSLDAKMQITDCLQYTFVFLKSFSNHSFIPKTKMLKNNLQELIVTYFFPYINSLCVLFAIKLRHVTLAYLTSTTVTSTKASVYDYFRFWPFKNVSEGIIKKKKS